MARIRLPKPVKLIVGLLSSDEDLLRRAQHLLTKKYGPTDLESDLVPFLETDYYEPEMGPNLRRRFLSFERLMRADDLPRVKNETNKLETAIADDTLDPSISRPVNIDPGYVDVAKLILATTKNHAHRVYMAEGIFAEVTMRIVDGAWKNWPWTYPDYQTPWAQAWFMKVRQKLREQHQAFETLTDSGPPA